MILLQILTDHESTAMEIGKMIIADDYALEIQISQKKNFIKGEKGDLKEIYHYKIACLMKANLFTPLVNFVTKKWGVEPKMFSLPVTQIEDDWAQDIRLKTRKS